MVIKAEYFGYKEPLKRRKTAFFASSIISSETALRVYNWATEMRNRGECIMSGFSSKIGTGCFSLPTEIMLVLARNKLKNYQDSNNLVLSGEGVGGKYPAFRMSDGERIILYLVGRILLAPYNALVIIDEPEMYLHKTIVDKLWNKLEIEIPDYVFLCLTHDLQFAANRNARK